MWRFFGFLLTNFQFLNRILVLQSQKPIIMNDNFKNITDSLIKNGFIESEENVKDLGRKLDFKITQYSLNTDLSFKFLNSDDFVNFLNYSNSEEITKEKIGLINASIIEQGLNPDDFFYVNFYKKEVNEL